MKKNKIILDLCGGTGSWGIPSKKSGFTVITITLPNHEIRATEFGDNGTIYFFGNEKPFLIIFTGQSSGVKFFADFWHIFEADY